jgi:MFS family permease
VAGVSALFAAQLAEWIGLIMTMVVTHLPSNVLLILVPLMPTELLAIAVLCVRFSISQMDVPTRNSFVMAVVDPDERSAAGGVTNIVRSIGASTAPYLAGLLYERPALRNVPFFIAGGLKIAYDLTLLASFASVKTPEEHARAQEKAAASERTPLNKV